MTDPYRRFSVRLYRHTGAVILWHQRTLTFTGTLEQCEKAYRDAQTHNLLAGWWSVVSLLVMNWIALISNYSAIRKDAPWPRRPRRPTPRTLMSPPARAVPRPASPVVPPPGWYPNPSGPGQRYWDGVTWTHWTHPR